MALTAVAIMAVGIITAVLVFGIRFCNARRRKQTTEEHPEEHHESQLSVPDSEMNEAGNQSNEPEVPSVDVEYGNHEYSNGQHDCIQMADISTAINIRVVNATE